MPQAAAAVVIPFPSQPEPESLDAIAREYLRIKRDLAALEARAKSLQPNLLAALQAEGDRGVAVPGLGSVTRFEASPAMRLDTNAATALLQQHGLDVPLTPSGGGWQLRANLI